MDLNRKKVLFIPLEGTLTEGGGVTEFRVRREVLDRIRKTNISRVAIIYDEQKDSDFNTKVKSVEFFVFAYCKVAVTSHRRCDDIVDVVMNILPHNLRRKDVLLSVGEKIEGMDYMDLKTFVG